MAQALGYLDATHLLRRSAARGNRAEAQKLVEMGLEGAVDYLLRPPVEAPPFSTAFTRPEKGPQHREITRLWLNHWLNTSTPAAERMVLFWHGHFTSEFRETKPAQGIDFWNQFATFRQLGYGSFGNLLKAIAKNPTMLMYLNNADSRKEHPNQNWARELLELFTLGPGNYTEADILEAARAFTGWSVRLQGQQKPKDAPSTVPFEYVFRPNWHDSGEKTFLGKKLKTGDEVLEVLIAHPITYRFIARKLLVAYLNPQPSPELISEGAKILQASSIREFLRWLFTQPAFFAPENRASIIKSPIEYTVGLLYSAGVRQPQSSDTESNRNKQLFNAFAAMGQIPFDPPNVKGWDGGLSWLAESPLLTRLNLISLIVGLEHNLDLEVFMDGASGPLSLVRPEAQLL